MNFGHHRRGFGERSHTQFIRQRGYELVILFYGGGVPAQRRVQAKHVLVGGFVQRICRGPAQGIAQRGGGVVLRKISDQAGKRRKILLARLGARAKQPGGVFVFEQVTGVEFHGGLQPGRLPCGEVRVKLGDIQRRCVERNAVAIGDQGLLGRVCQAAAQAIQRIAQELTGAVFGEFGPQGAGQARTAHGVTGAQREVSENLGLCSVKHSPVPVYFDTYRAKKGNSQQNNRAIASFIEVCEKSLRRLYARGLSLLRPRTGQESGGPGLHGRGQLIDRLLNDRPRGGDRHAPKARPFAPKPVAGSDGDTRLFGQEAGQVFGVHFQAAEIHPGEKGALWLDKTDAGDIGSQRISKQAVVAVDIGQRLVQPAAAGLDSRLRWLRWKRRWPC